MNIENPQDLPNPPNSTILNRAELIVLSKLWPWRSGRRIVFELFLIMGLVFLHSSHIIPSWTLPMVLLGIATRQHALLVLMHEGAHFRLLRSRFWNDVISEFIAWNMFFSMYGYRRHHKRHHVLENINTLEDPDWARKQHAQWSFPMRWQNFLGLIVRDLTLLNTMDLFKEARDAKNFTLTSRKEQIGFIARITYSLLFVVLMMNLQIWREWLLYWILPIFTVLKALLRIRGIADHFGLKNDPLYSRTRTVLAGLLGRIFIGPCSIGIHGVHHVYPSIPYYHLKRAHFLMMKSIEYRPSAHVTLGYARALGEVLVK